MKSFKELALATVSIAAVAMSSAAVAATAAAPAGPYANPGNWTTINGNKAQTKYSTLNQINTGNVANLTKAWSFPGGGQVLSPIAVDGVLYYASGQRVTAVDGDTGKMIWAVNLNALVPMPADRGINPARPANFGGAGNREGAATAGFLVLGNAAKYGASYWPGTGKIGPRVVVATGAGYLVTIDAKTGKLATDFGRGGVVDLRVGVMEKMNLSDWTPGALPTIYKNLAIVTPRTSENGRYGTPGDPRAFDLTTGKEVWRFHVIPQPGEENFGEWGLNGWEDRRGAGSWVPVAVDEKNNLVFISTGNATDQNFGGTRPGSNLYATSVIALNGDTGKRVWHFQTTHHDIYDWDIPSPAVLIDMKDRNGQLVEAVAQPTKNGYLFVLDRKTGKPVLPMEERRIPPTDVPGELASPTQPRPLKPEPISRVSLTRDEVANLSPESHKFCMDIYDNVVQMGEGTPYGMVPSLVFPSSTGGPNTGGVTFDPVNNIMFVNVQDLGTIAMNTPALSAGQFETLSKSKIPFVDQQGYPCSAPPWGELLAIDAASGDVLWKKTIGEFDELTAKGVPITGQQPTGGSTVTAGGVLFVGATQDRRFRAIEAKTGRILWETRLVGQGGSTPITYTGKSGKQYVAIVSGGGRAVGPAAGGAGGAAAAAPPQSDVPAGLPGELVAFALP